MPVFLARLSVWGARVWSGWASGLSIDKNVTVVESWFYTAAETTDYGSVSTDRDSARLAINAAQESPWTAGQIAHSGLSW
jgi:hypothetical protein